jgi:hypothetical protein
MSISFGAHTYASRNSGRVTAGPFDSGSDLLSWSEFAVAVTLHLWRLRDVRNPVALFAIGPAELAMGTPARLIAEALAPLGVTGALLDNRIGFLYLGPLVRAGEVSFLTNLRRRIAETLESSGWGVAARAIDIAPHFGWTDEVTSADDLVQSLVSAGDCSIGVGLD